MWKLKIQTLSRPVESIDFCQVRKDDAESTYIDEQAFLKMESICTLCLLELG